MYCGKIMWMRKYTWKPGVVAMIHRLPTECFNEFFLIFFYPFSKVNFFFSTKKIYKSLFLLFFLTFKNFYNRNVDCQINDKLKDEKGWGNWRRR